MLHAMIMAGGGGTRFWPRSRKVRPKQFLNVVGDRTLIQMAFDRVEAQIPPPCVWVVTSQQHQDETARQLPELKAEHIVGEPCGRDTAACVGLGAALIAREDPSATILVMPADHVIEPVQEFRRAVHVADRTVEDHPDSLVTFGIPPLFPSTGYGYIHRDAQPKSVQGVPVFRAQQFVEKPKADVAERMIHSGEFFWNSGIFVWKAATILNELKQRQRPLFDAVERIADAWPTPKRLDVLRQEYQELKKIPIDKAVMEHAQEVFVVQAPFRWDDVGSWLAVERMHPQDAEGNTVLANHTGLATGNCVIVGDQDHLLTTIGVRDLVIIQDGNATLVAHRSDEGTVKQLVEALEKKKLEQYL